MDEPTRRPMLQFRKSSYSNPSNCVEVADTLHGAAVRDTQHRHLGHIEFPAVEWKALLHALDAGEL
ncbi:DUF397 domain-containing protein [Streptomonospora litoralis]|uniref:DUF397 domain-containing protein n=1 Tax=Streptomonospora litoralis TaxID=2498135 RepID=A0A4P6Q2P4_9ACTN|nr:DUF397 domain-containing protein [Streptomonospora litoralis]QBI52917.1 hypothetical protein EKD16_05570 [Streptomonospora litoralis]